MKSDPERILHNNNGISFCTIQVSPRVTSKEAQDQLKFIAHALEFEDSRFLIIPAHRQDETSTLPHSATEFSEPAKFRAILHQTAEVYS